MSFDVRKDTLMQVLSRPGVWANAGRYKNPLLGLGLMVILLTLSVGIAVMAPTTSVIPTMSIVGVVEDQTVTIDTENFPANRDFVVTMGLMGTRGINGIVVDTTNSGAGGSFTETYAIPAALHGLNQIAIRLQSTTGGYFAYNWFYNNTYPGTGNGAGDGAGAGTGGAAYTGIPTFSIESVDAGESVTIRTNNFPRNREFVVTMGPMGTKGINGIPVATTDSGAGGVFASTYQIPETLQGAARIAIRLQATSGGFYAYNWFSNSTSGGGAGDGGVVTPTPTPIPPPTDDDNGYTGYPWFEVASVQQDQSVTVNAYNLPSDQQFVVTMGPMGTEGINGIAVATTDSGEGGDLTATYQIPQALRGLPRIALRLESAQGYYAYNWFYNTTTN